MTYGSTAFAAGVKIFNVSSITFFEQQDPRELQLRLWFDTNWNHVTITGNEIYGNLRDIYDNNQRSIGLLMDTKLAGKAYTDNVIANNYIHDENVGMLISTASDMDIHDNAFSANRIATIRAFEEPARY